jgi:hypothetical protein
MFPRFTIGAIGAIGALLLSAVLAKHLIARRESAFDLLRLESALETELNNRQQRLNARSIGKTPN